MALLHRCGDRGPCPRRRSGGFPVSATFRAALHPASVTFERNGSGAAQRRLLGVCYMWWDRFPCIALARDPNLPTMQETALRTMASILGFSSIACQESALHGLGHWQRHHDQQVNA